LEGGYGNGGGQGGGCCLVEVFLCMYGEVILIRSFPGGGFVLDTGSFELEKFACCY